MNIKKKILTIKTIKVIFDVTIIITSLALLFLLFAFAFGISNDNEIFSKGYALIEQDKNTQIELKGESIDETYLTPSTSRFSSLSFNSFNF